MPASCSATTWWSTTVTACTAPTRTCAAGRWVAVGDRVQAGQQLAEVGNSGNSSESHLHVQLMDDPMVTAAAGVPFRWEGIEVAPGDIDLTRSTKPVATDIEPGLPANGQVFTVA